MDASDFRRTCICETHDEMCVPLKEVGSKTDVLFSEIASLRAKLEAAEKDTERLNLLAETLADVECATHGDAEPDWTIVANNGAILSYAVDLREAIDAARES